MQKVSRAPKRGKKSKATTTAMVVASADDITKRLGVLERRIDKSRRADARAAMRMRPDVALQGSIEDDATIGETIRYLFTHEGLPLAEAALGDLAADLEALLSNESLVGPAFDDALWRIQRRAEAARVLVAHAREAQS